MTDRDVEERLATEVKLEQQAQPDPQVLQVGDRAGLSTLCFYRGHTIK